MATRDDVAFIEFILNCHEIELEVNKPDTDDKTAFQVIYENNSIPKYTPIKSLFKRGYILTENDKVFFSKITEIEGDRKNDILIYDFYNKLDDKNLVELIFDHSKLLFIIESARRQEIIGFDYRPNEWIAFANNAIQYHSEYWEYIEMAFKGFGLWEILTQLDKKGTFEKKVLAFYSKMPKQKYDFDEVFRDLYPELHY
jgi:hypothetical protein